MWFLKTFSITFIQGHRMLIIHVVSYSLKILTDKENIENACLTTTSPVQFFQDSKLLFTPGTYLFLKNLFHWVLSLFFTFTTELYRELFVHLLSEGITHYVIRPSVCVKPRGKLILDCSARNQRPSYSWKYCLLMWKITAKFESALI